MIELEHKECLNSSSIHNSIKEAGEFDYLIIGSRCTEMSLSLVW